MQKAVKLKVKNYRKWANGQIIYDLKKEIDSQGVILTLTWSYLHVSNYYSQIPGGRLQDHWSPGILELIFVQRR